MANKKMTDVIVDVTVHVTRYYDDAQEFRGLLVNCARGVKE